MAAFHSCFIACRRNSIKPASNYFSSRIGRLVGYYRGAEMSRELTAWLCADAEKASGSESLCGFSPPHRGCGSSACSRSSLQLYGRSVRVCQLQQKDWNVVVLKWDKDLWGSISVGHLYIVTMLYVFITGQLLMNKGKQLWVLWWKQDTTYAFSTKKIYRSTQMLESQVS